MSDYAGRITAALGDASTLAHLAIEMAQQIARLESAAATLKEAAAARAAEDEAKRAKDAERKRRVRSGPGMSTDVHGQDGTEADGSPSPLPSLDPQTPINPSFPPPSPTPPAPVIRTLRDTPLVRPDVASVLAHYVRLHPRRKPGGADRKTVEKALGLGYSAAELCEALDGNAADEWHRTKRKHDLSYVLRNNGQIDNFRASAEAADSAAGIAVRDGWFVEAG